jgi:DNA-damage-inducible protein J
MTTVNVRIEEKTKKAASKALKEMGLDLSSGIKLFLNQVAVEKSLPFRPTTSVPRVSRARLDAEFEDAIKNGKRYTSAKEMFDDLLK